MNIFNKWYKLIVLSKAFWLLGVAAYLDIDVVEADQYITDGSADGGFDAAYIDESGDSELNVISFQSKECGLELSQLDHKSFGIVLNKFEESKEVYFDEAEHQLTRVLLEHFNVKTLLEIDGRTVAAVFRRFDLLEKLT